MLGPLKIINPKVELGELSNEASRCSK